jgi:signal recognition particle GTPase
MKNTIRKSLIICHKILKEISLLRWSIENQLFGVSEKILINSPEQEFKDDQEKQNILIAAKKLTPIRVVMMGGVPGSGKTTQPD